MLLSIVATINLFVDPGKIYLKKIVKEYQATAYVKKVLSSKIGLYQSGWNERLIKTTMAKKASEYDCVVLGSSHVMQISYLRNTGNIQKQCTNLLNLGVSGGSIEDILVLSSLLFKNKKLPEKVFIGIDPWTLKYNMDSRYGAYIEEYVNMKNLLKSKSIRIVPYRNKVIKNLINGEYFYHSIEEILEKKLEVFDYFKGTNPISIKNIDYNKGIKYAVTLSDGSHVYASSYIFKQKNKNPNILLGGGSYKIKGQAFSRNAARDLNKLISFYQDRAVEVNLILTPYHPHVFELGETKITKHMKIVERVTREIAKKERIKGTSKNSNNLKPQFS